MILWILIAVISGAGVGVMAMAIVSSGAQADQRTRYYRMKEVLFKVLKWSQEPLGGSQDVFPEKEVMEVLRDD
jgi:hypothetical protein